MNRVLRLGFMGTALAALLVAGVWLFQAGGLGGAQGGTGGLSSVRRLANACSSSVGDDGFGRVRISERLIVSSGEGEITVPCRLTMERGGSLQLNNVKLRTKHLVIRDYKPNGETQVWLNNSDLVATGRHGLELKLSDGEDSVSIHRSTINYPLVAAMGVNDLEENAGRDNGRIEVTNSTIRSLDPKSDGIKIVAGEKAGLLKLEMVKLETVRLEAKPDTQNVLLYAGDCSLQRVQGYQGTCDADDMARQILGGSGRPVQPVE